LTLVGASPQPDDENVISPDRGRERVVVGIDDSDGARRALCWAAHEAARRDALLDVVHVYGTARGTELSPLHDQMHDHHEEALLAKELLERSVPPLTNASNLDAGDVHTFALAGDPAEVLVEMAKGADLLVVGSRGRGGLAGLLLGSVGRYCTTHAPCPVCVVPARS
jgi:nucleotide-binding universal stress UspA family protein